MPNRSAMSSLCHLAQDRDSGIPLVAHRWSLQRAVGVPDYESASYLCTLMAIPLKAQSSRQSPSIDGACCSLAQAERWRDTGGWGADCNEASEGERLEDK